MKRTAMVSLFVVLMSAFVASNGMTESICQDIKAELDYAVKEGVISREVAREVAGRCFDNLEREQENGSK